MQYGRRPYGVGFIVAGVDSKGPHIFQVRAHFNNFSAPSIEKYKLCDFDSILTIYGQALTLVLCIHVLVVTCCIGYQTCPSSNYYSCKAMAIGARYQSAKTYLERGLAKFDDGNYTPTDTVQHPPNCIRPPYLSLYPIRLSPTLLHALSIPSTVLEHAWF